MASKTHYLYENGRMDEEQQEQAKQENCFTSLKNLLHEFCSYTSWGGLGRVVGTKFIIFKILWLLIFLAALGMAGFQLIPLFFKYRSRPISTRISLHHNATLEFPSVVFCNFNMIRRKKMFNLPDSIIKSMKEYVSAKTYREIMAKIKNEDEREADGEDQDGEQKDDDHGQNGDDRGDADYEDNGHYDENGHKGNDSNTDGNNYRKRRSDQDEDDENDENDDGDDREDESGEELPDEMNPDLLDTMYKSEEKLSILLAALHHKDLQKGGHQFIDMFEGCTFKGMDCRNFTKYWSVFWHYKYGNCFVFNPYIVTKNNQTMKARRPLTASKPGPRYGLTVAMNIEQYEYVDQLTQTAGAVVLILERGKMPFPYEEGISVAPGFSTSLGIRMLNIHREDRFNNGSCIKDDTVGKDNIYNRKFNITYSRTACEQSCIARTQLKLCKCLEYKYPGVDDFYFCDVLNKTVVACLRKVAKKAKDGQLECSGCQPLCDDKSFKVTSSFAKWPSLRYEKYLNFEDVDNATKVSKKVNKMSNNNLKVQVFFQELNFEYIEETISYQLENFLSDIGGQLGLWLGASTLSGIEVVELLVFIVLYLLGRKTLTDQNEEIPLKERETETNATNAVAV